MSVSCGNEPMVVDEDGAGVLRPTRIGAAFHPLGLAIGLRTRPYGGTAPAARDQSVRPRGGAPPSSHRHVYCALGVYATAKKNNTERAKSYDGNDKESDAVPDVDIAHVLLHFGNESSHGPRYAPDCGITSVGFGLTTTKQRKKGRNNMSPRYRSHAGVRGNLLLSLA